MIINEQRIIEGTKEDYIYFLLHLFSFQTPIFKHLII